MSDNQSLADLQINDVSNHHWSMSKCVPWNGCYIRSRVTPCHTDIDCLRMVWTDIMWYEQDPSPCYKTSNLSQSYQFSVSNLRARGSREPTSCTNTAHDVNHQSPDICSMPPTPQSLPPTHCIVPGPKPLPSGPCIAAARIHSTCHAFSHTIPKFLATWATALNLFPTAWYCCRPLTFNNTTIPRCS